MCVCVCIIISHTKTNTIELHTYRYTHTYNSHNLLFATSFPANSRVNTTSSAMNA